MDKRRTRHSRGQEIKAYEFLKSRLQASAPFTVAELAGHVGWKKATPQTYVSKHWADILERVDKDKYAVKPEFARLSLEQFLAHGTQLRPIFTAYRRRKHEHLVVYEFLLPLTREDQLRRALDDLFYTDTILRRLEEIGVDKIGQVIERTNNESDSGFLERVLQFIAGKIGGYSISHVSGRFRAGSVKTRKEAGDYLAGGEQYLIEETTALVRFILPCDYGVVKYERDFESIGTALDSTAEKNEELQHEVRQIRWLFYHLFVEAVARTVGEQEIWLLEESPFGHRLYVWARQ